MYQATVTVFNSYEYRTTKQVLWFPHVLTGCDIITDKGQMLQRYGPDSTDSAELHVAFAVLDGKKVIIDSITGQPILNTMGEPLPYISPMLWEKQVNDLLDDTITFAPSSFFWWGEWTDGPVNDEDYNGGKYTGFFDYMNQTRDYVYKVTTVGGPYSVIPHFEIRGA